MSVLEIQKVERKFKLKIANQDVILDDPNENMAPDEVMDLYSTQYPELLNAKIINHGIENHVMSYEFSTIAGTKG